MPENTSKKDFSKLYVPGAIVLAGVIIGISLVVALSPRQSAVNQGGTAKVNIKDVHIEGDPFIGEPNAPVTMAYWSDYQCPFCKAVEVGGVPQIPLEPAIPKLIQEYVNTGKLKIVFKDYPFLGQDSTIAALYEHAIWKLYPTKFYEWREAMYKAQDDEGDQGFGDEASIIALTNKISGLDAAKIKADVAANKAEYQAKIDADRQEGAGFGVQGTPGFIIGKTLIPGAAEYAQFKQLIDAQL